MGKSIEKKVKLRIVYCVILIVLGAASLYVGNFVTLDSGNADYATGYYIGLGYGLIAAAVITLIKNILLLKNPEKLKEREVYEADERNRMIGMKMWSYAGYALFILLYLGILVAGLIDVLILKTLLIVLAAFVLSLFISRVVLTKIM